MIGSGVQNTGVNYFVFVLLNIFSFFYYLVSSLRVNLGLDYG